jgi:hypothetical protein
MSPCVAGCDLSETGASMIVFDQILMTPKIHKKFKVKICTFQKTTSEGQDFLIASTVFQLKFNYKFVYDNQ